MESSTVRLSGMESLRRGWILVSAGEMSWLITGGTSEKMDLCPGREVDPEEMDRIAFREQLPGALSDLQRFLTGAEHTVKQLHDYLAGRKYHPDVIDDLLRRAFDAGLVDDRRYAEIFVRSHSQRSPMGNFRLRMELRTRGVPPDIVEEILSEREEDDLYRVLVTEVRGRYGGMEGERALRRASGYLRRRGFDFDLVRRVLEDALGSSEEPSG